jgi:hypothetical protein
MEAISMPDATTPSLTATRLGIYSGWGVLAFMGAGLIPFFIPPPGPYDAATTAAFYHEQIDLKRTAVLCLIIGGTMMIPFGAAIADRLRRVQGVGPAVAFAQLGAAIANATLMMTFGSFLLVALHRPDMPDSTYQLLNHVTWMAWAGLWQPGALMAVMVAVGIFSDKSITPVFPRWVGWYCIFMAFGSLMGSLIPFVLTGPFSWTGVMGFYLAGTVYFAWFAMILTQLHLAYRRDRTQLQTVAADHDQSSPSAIPAVSGTR